jgi:leucyl-tRNA synthetase
MVCHQTYKDQKNNWLTPDEVYSEDGKTFLIKDKPEEKAIVGPSESMSKSKRNTIDPGKMINVYGADAVRFFILSDSPPEKDIQWSDSGMASSFKYIQKFWQLNEKISKIIENEKKEKDEEIDFFVNQAINKINYALENFRYNVIIAVFHELYSFFNKLSESKLNYSNLKNNYRKILIVMMPVIPHIINECLEKIKENEDVMWPKVDKKFIHSDKCNIVVQINGKKRSLLSVEKNLEEKIIMEKIHNDKSLDKYFLEKKILKTIYIKDKIINLIIK